MNLFFYFLVFSLTIISQNLANNTSSQPEKTPEHFIVTPAPNITVNFPLNIELNNKNNSTTDATTSSQSQSVTKSITFNKTITTTMMTMTNEIKNSMQSIQKIAGEIPGRLQPWIFQNKWHMLLSGAALAYVYTWYQLLYLSYTLSEPTAWHNYKATASFDELLRIKQDDLAQEIIRAIQNRYAPQAIQDFFMPFTLFNKEIEQEIELLEQFIAICKRIRLLRIRWLFPWQNSSYEYAQDKLRRVLYFRTVAFSWLGSFKLEKYMQLAPEHVFSINKTWLFSKKIP